MNLLQQTNFIQTKAVPLKNKFRGKPLQKKFLSDPFTGKFAKFGVGLSKEQIAEYKEKLHHVVLGSYQQSLIFGHSHWLFDKTKSAWRHKYDKSKQALLKRIFEQKLATKFEIDKNGDMILIYGE